jgi:hypothetical protein
MYGVSLEYPYSWYLISTVKEGLFLHFGTLKIGLPDPEKQKTTL